MNNRMSRLGMVFVLALGLFLSGCANSTQPQNATPPPVQSTGGPPLYEGYLDVANCDGISGWAWNKKQPDNAVDVDIYDGDKKLATVPADALRPDLVKANLGNGRHAFTYPVPANLRDGNEHTIHARVSGASADLPSPKPLNCK